jgi:hypothetical protein
MSETTSEEQLEARIETAYQRFLRTEPGTIRWSTEPQVFLNTVKATVEKNIGEECTLFNMSDPDRPPSMKTPAAASQGIGTGPGPVAGSDTPHVRR